MAMMRKRNPATQEDGFHWLLPRAAEYVQELIDEFDKEEDHGLRCWLLELIGAAKSPDAIDFLAGQLRGSDERLRWWAVWGLKNLGTAEARTLLWKARSFTFQTPEETKSFRNELDAILKEPG
jgi:HEAT repeat protein